MLCSFVEYANLKNPELKNLIRMEKNMKFLQEKF